MKEIVMEEVSLYEVWVERVLGCTQSLNMLVHTPT